jgi:hypothetical protein
LVNITETKRKFEYSRRRRNLEQLQDVAEDHDERRRQLQNSSSIPPTLAPSQRDAPSSAPTFALTFNIEDDSYSNFFLGFSGTCDGCESDIRLFDDAVAIATYRRRRLSDMRSLQETCTEGNNDLRAPLAREILEHFRINLEALGLPYDVINLREVFREACPAPGNAFTATSEESTYTILTDAAITSDGLSNALAVLTDPTAFVGLHGQFMEGYCDRFYRRLTTAVSGSSDLSIEGDTVIITLSFQSLVGTCRGCENLFGSLTDLRQRHLREGAEKQSTSRSRRASFLPTRFRSRTLQERFCWCNTNATPRGPIQDEFELYLTAMFEKIVGMSTKLT